MGRSGWFCGAPSSPSSLEAAPWSEVAPPVRLEIAPGSAECQCFPLTWSRGREDKILRQRQTKEGASREVHVLLTSLSFAVRPCCPSPACGWCFQALWLSHPAARTLWHAAHSFHVEHPAALRGTMGKNTLKCMGLRVGINRHNNSSNGAADNMGIVITGYIQMMIFPGWQTGKSSFSTSFSNNTIAEAT